MQSQTALPKPVWPLDPNWLGTAWRTGFSEAPRERVDKGKEAEDQVKELLSHPGNLMLARATPPFVSPPCPFLVFPPQVFHEQGILFGYRHPQSSATACILSLFQMTNETLNIWTHLLPFWYLRPPWTAYLIRDPWGLDFVKHSWVAGRFYARAGGVPSVGTGARVTGEEAGTVTD